MVTGSKVKVKKCPVCNKRPVADGSQYCARCQQRINSINSRPVAAKKPELYITYKGKVVEVYSNRPLQVRNGMVVSAQSDSQLTFKPTHLLAEQLPISKTLNLNEWCEGFTRQMIKSLKATVLQVAR